MSTCMMFDIAQANSFEEEEEKDELDDSVLDELEGDDLVDEEVEDHGLMAAPESEKSLEVFDGDAKDGDLPLEEEEGDVDDYDSFDDEDDL